MSTARLSTSVLAATPGREVGCDVHLTNPTDEVLTLDVEVDGPAEGWSVVQPSPLVLAPAESGRARVSFTVPDCDDLAGSTRPFVVKVTGGPPVELAGRIDIADVRDLRVSIRPLVARARRMTTHTVTVQNLGTGPARTTLVPRETAGHLKLRLLEERVEVAAGEQATVEVRVTPRRPLLIGRSRPHPFAVEARPEAGSPVTAEATRFQDPLRWRRGAVVGALALAVALAAALLPDNDGGSDGTQIAGAAPAAVTPVSLGSACAAMGSTETAALEIAGFAYCPATLTVGVGAEVVWTNADLAPHTVTYDGPEAAVDSGSMAQGQSWSTRFGQAGTYQYYCRFHPGMWGTIVVASIR